MPSDACLAVKDPDLTVKRYRIRRRPDGGFSISRACHFPDLESLIEYYRQNADGLCCRLESVCIDPEPPSAGPDPRREIPREEIAYIRDLGSGRFGTVFEGRWNATPVAVRTLPSDCAEFLAKVEIAKQLQHPKLAQVYGLCSVGEPVYVVTELAECGTLLDYLRSASGKDLGLPKLIDIAMQVANGMAYLEANNFVHGNLKAQNVLVGKHLMCKVGDFGMGWFACSTEPPDGVQMLPLEWTAPEAAFYARYTVKSDVWSFGIFLTELVKGGAVPYRGVTDFLERVDRGYRIPQPKDCPDWLYEVMMACWNENPGQRPTFDGLQWTLESDM